MASSSAMQTLSFSITFLSVASSHALTASFADSYVVSAHSSDAITSAPSSFAFTDAVKFFESSPLDTSSMQFIFSSLFSVLKTCIAAAASSASSSYVLLSPENVRAVGFTPTIGLSRSMSASSASSMRLAESAASSASTGIITTALGFQPTSMFINSFISACVAYSFMIYSIPYWPLRLSSVELSSAFMPSSSSSSDDGKSTAILGFTF